MQAIKHQGRKIFDVEMLIRTLLTTLLQILCIIILTFKVLVKSVIEPEDIFWRKS